MSNIASVPAGTPGPNNTTTTVNTAGGTMTGPLVITVDSGVPLTITQNNTGNVNGLVLTHAAASTGSQAALLLTTSNAAAKGLRIIDSGLSGNCIEMPMQTDANHRPHITWRDFTNDDAVVTLLAHEKDALGATHNHFSLYTSDAAHTGRNRMEVEFGKLDPDVSFQSIGTMSVTNADGAQTAKDNRNLADNLFEGTFNLIVNDGLTYTKSGNVMWLQNTQTETSGTITDSAVVLKLTQNGDTGDALTIDNASTGNAIGITQSTSVGTNVITDGALHIDNSNNNSHAFAIYSTKGSAATAPLVYWANVSSTFGRNMLRLQAQGSGDLLLIDNRGTGKGLIFKNNTTEYLNIDAVGKLTTQANAINIATSQTPATASATGTTGDIAWDSSFIYVCTATNTWKRAAITTW